MFDKLSAKILTASDVQEEFDDSHLFPQKSKILYQLMEGDDWRLEVFDPVRRKRVPAYLEFGEVDYEGGSASIEQEQGMLLDAIAELLEEDVMCVGWWVMEGFYGSYSRDYYGETDVDFECDDIRRAKYSDLHEFGWLTKWHQRVLLFLGIDLEVR